jgi:hypothetical protein
MKYASMLRNETSMDIVGKKFKEIIDLAVANKRGK